MQAGGPFADIEGLEKSSSDGLVKDVLIWQHRALILLSPSPGNPISISGITKKEERRGMWGKREGTKAVRRRMKRKRWNGIR